MATKAERRFDPPPRDFVPRLLIVKHQGQWGFFLPSGTFWALIAQVNGPELARRQLVARYARSGR
jgi:hypothetical protein